MRFTLTKFVGVCSFIILVFALSQLFGCGTLNSTPTLCDDVVSIFSILGKSVCASLNATTPTAGSMVKTSGEMKQVVVNKDTVDYSYHVASDGQINITWKSSRGLEGYVQVAHSNVFKE